MIFLDKVDNKNFIQFIQATNILLYQDMRRKLCVYIESKINEETALIYYQLASFIHLTNFAKEIFSYIQRDFLTVAETKQFLKLDYKVLAKIISSCQLSTTSELEVFDRVDSWLSYDISKRNKYAKELLFKIRLPLLSYSHLDYVLNKSSSFRNNEECRKLIQRALNDKESVNQKDTNFYSTIRYCDQNKFNIFAFDGVESPKFFRVDEKNVKCVKELSTLKYRQLDEYYQDLFFKAVYLKGFIYVFDRNKHNDRISLDKYNLKTNTWKREEYFLGCRIRGFGACAFMNDIYLIGGNHLTYGCTTETNRCFKFDTNKEFSLEDINPMDEVRTFAACTTFEGRIVVSGGISDVVDNFFTNSVEEYDHIADRWLYMSDMTYGRSGHCLIAVKDKLFAIGGRYRSSKTDMCEVYDSFCEKFVVMKSPPRPFKAGFHNSVAAVSIQSKIIVFDSQMIAFYDIAEDQWSEISYDSKTTYDFSNCIRVPQIY